MKASLALSRNNIGSVSPEGCLSATVGINQAPFQSSFLSQVSLKTELEMRFVFRLVAPPAGQEELGLCAEDCDTYTTADRRPSFCGGGPDEFRVWVQRQVDSLMGPGALTEPRKLILRFVVEKDGRMTPAPEPKYRDEDALEKAVRGVLTAAPAWTPATIAGERVRFSASIPVAFGPGAAGAEYNDRDAYQVVEIMPKFFGGGLDKFRSWVMAEVKYLRPFRTDRRLYFGYFYGDG